MKAVQFSNYGGPEVLRVVEVDEPHAGPGVPSHVLSVANFSAEQYGAKFSHGPPKDLERVLADVARLCSQGLFRLRVEQTFLLEQAAEAQKISATGHVTGKLIVCPL